MAMNRKSVAVICAAGSALLGGFGLVCCSRPTGPGVTVTQPPTATPDEATHPSDSEPTAARDRVEEPPETAAPRDNPADTAPPIEMETPAEPEPKTPRYLDIVEELDASRRALVEATIVAPTKLELNTQNVKRLRITREGLPLARDRSIVLRIDGQGIEWTRQYVSVELERSPAGAWTVVRRRPVEP